MKEKNTFIPACIPPTKSVISDKENLNISVSDYCDINVHRIGHMVATPLQFYASFFERTEYCIQYVTKGEGDFFVNNRLYKLKKNTLFLLPKRNYHYYAANKDNPYEYLWIHFTGKGFERFMKEIGISESNPVLYNLVNPNIEKRFYELIDLCKGNQEQNKFLIFSKSYSLLHEFSISSLPTQVLHDKHSHSRIDEIIEYINEYYQDDLTLEFLANKFFINKYYLVKQFKKATSLSPIQYLIQYRIGASTALLRGTTLSISEIAERCGFHSQTNFLLRFKEILGVTPSEYRKSVHVTSHKGKRRK